MSLTKITSDITDSSIANVEFLTQAEYDAISTPSSSTIYIITE
jgi:hypothetical protein